MPPTASASGASRRWRRLCSSTARAIAASSPSRTARAIAANRSAHSREVISLFDDRTRLAVLVAHPRRGDAEDEHHDDQSEEDPLGPLVGLVQLPGLLGRDSNEAADGDVRPAVEHVFDGQEGEQRPVVQLLGHAVAVLALPAAAQPPPDRREQQPPAADLGGSSTREAASVIASCSYSLSSISRTAWSSGPATSSQAPRNPHQAMM